MTKIFELPKDQKKNLTMPKLNIWKELQRQENSFPLVVSGRYKTIEFKTIFITVVIKKSACVYH